MEKMGDLMVPQIYLAHWARLRVFKGLGRHACRSARWGMFYWEELGHLWERGVNAGTSWTTDP